MKRPRRKKKGLRTGCVYVQMSIGGSDVLCRSRTGLTGPSLKACVNKYGRIPIPRLFSTSREKPRLLKPDQYLFCFSIFITGSGSDPDLLYNGGPNICCPGSSTAVILLLYYIY